MKKLFYFSFVVWISLVTLSAETVQSVLQSLALSENPERKLQAVKMVESLDEESYFFQFQDANYKGNQRCIKFQDAKIINDRAGVISGLESQVLTNLTEEDLKMDLLVLKKKAREIAKVAEVNPTRYEYNLKHPNGRKTAFWQIVLLDGKANSLGQLALDARSGKTTAVSWQENEEKPTMKKTSMVKKETPQKKEGFGHSVEKTFRGVGADLEEFFTGERTVDKD